MFRSKEKPNPNITDTFIGEGSVFEGNIKSAASIRIEGQFIGDVTCQGDVTIGEKASVRSNISARHITLAGKVQGNVTASGKLLLLATGQLLGNLSTKELVVEMGGIFEGNSKMDDNDAPGKDPLTSEEKSANVESESEHARALKSW